MAGNYNEVTILVVDDDDLDVIGIKRAFKKMRIANPIVRAENGVEGLKLLRGELAEKAVIVLLDLNMPIMGGIEFLKVLREDKNLSSTIVFVLTTSKLDEDKLAAYDKNIAGYVVKSELDASFQGLIDLLTTYWRIIELPDTGSKVEN